MKRRAGLYVRISDDKEGRSLGVERQERDCLKLAKAKGWAVLEVYSDNDRSATSGKARPAWEQMLRDLEAHKIDAVVAYSSSRLYRRPRDLQKLIDLTKQNGGVDIATVASGRIVLDTADGRMLAGILAQIDQGEAERTSERVARKHLEKAEQGRPHGGGRRPFGYDWDSKAGTWKIREAEAKTVRRIAKHLITGGSLSGIVRQLNLEGVTTATGSRWSTGTVRKLMTNPTIAGLRVHRRTALMVAGDWPAIVTPQQRELLLAIFKGTTRLRGGGSTERKRLLSGILVCKKCGSKMYGDGKGGYVCHKSWKGCGNVRISSAPLEDYVTWEAFQRLAELRKAGRVREHDSDNSDTDGLAEQRMVLEHRRDDFASKLALGTIDDRAYKVGVHAIDAELDKLDEQLRATVSILPLDDDAFVGIIAEPKVGANWTATLSPAEILERYELLRKLIDRVEVAPASRRGIRWEPSRLTIVWR